METSTSDKNAEIKKPRERSKEYPSYDIKTCLDFTEEINTKLGNRFSSREQIAKAVGKAPPTIDTKLSACKQFGFLELSKGEGYKPTELFLKATRGRTEQDKHTSLLAAIQTPTIYQDFIQKFNGQVIPEDIPSIFYWDYKITEKAKDDAAKIFLESLEFLKLISAERKLILEPNKTPDVIPPAVEVPTSINNVIVADNKGDAGHQETPPPEQRINDSIYKTKKADIKVSPGRFVFLEYPTDISNAEIEKLQKIIETWKD